MPDIKSETDGSKPWYEFTVSDKTLTIDVDADGGLDGSVEGESVEIPTDGFVAVSNNGELVTDSVDEGLRTKLIWHDSDGNLVRLNFVQE